MGHVLRLDVVPNGVTHPPAEARRPDQDEKMAPMRTVWEVLAVLAVLLAAGCSSGGERSGGLPPRHHRRHHPLHVTSRVTDKPYHFDGHGANVSARMFGHRWPLTVRSGRVNCIPTGGGRTIVVFTANNRRTYPLNGTAKVVGPRIGLHLHPLASIWARNPQVKGLRKDISPLLDVCAPVMN